MLTKKIEREILKHLGPLHPKMIILFGSHAYGVPNKDSDIDLYVVTNDDFMPGSYREGMNCYLKVSSRLRDMRRKYSIDIIVHTKNMHEKFIRLGSSFSRELMEKGIVIYEANNSGMAEGRKRRPANN